MGRLNIILPTDKPLKFDIRSQHFKVDKFNTAKYAQMFTTIVTQIFIFEVIHRKLGRLDYSAILYNLHDINVMYLLFESIFHLFEPKFPS